MIGRIASKGLRLTGLLSSSAHTSTPSTVSSCRLNNLRAFSSSHITRTQWTDEDFKSVVSENPLVLFMKGTPDAPQCGFSKYTCQILNMHGCNDVQTFNVLEDEVLRHRVKEF